MVEKLFRTVKIALGLSIFFVAMRGRSWDLIYRKITEVFWIPG